MTRLTYPIIFKKTLILFLKSLNLKNLTKLFFHSLVFRSLMLLIAFIIPEYHYIICSFIFIYILLVKPYINSKGEFKVFFSKLIFIFFTLATLAIMWYIIINSFNIFFPLGLELIVSKFLSLSAGLKVTNSENLSNGIVKNSEWDKYKYENFYEKTPKSSNMLAKIYNSLFNTNKQVCTIKPFPFVKEAYIKTSSLNSDPSNSSSSLTEYLSNKLGDNKHNQLTPNINNESEDGGSLYSSSSSSYNTVVIELKVFKATDNNNKQYLILKDLNDLSSENLVNIVNKPGSIKVVYDKQHVENKSCTNHKYLAFDTQNFNSKGYEKKMSEKYPGMMVPDRNTVRDITFSINNEAINRINNNSLIIESDNCNRLPVKELSSFASSSQNFHSDYWKISIPIPQNMETIRVFSQRECTIITPNCADCTNIN